jgi:hypothetical protein
MPIKVVVSLLATASRRMKRGKEVRDENAQNAYRLYAISA